MTLLYFKKLTFQKLETFIGIYARPISGDDTFDHTMILDLFFNLNFIEISESPIFWLLVKYESKIVGIEMLKLYQSSI